MCFKFMTKTFLLAITLIFIAGCSAQNEINNGSTKNQETEMFKSMINNFGPDYYQNVTNLHPLGLGKAEDVAGIIAFLLSNMSKWITGSIINVDGGYTAQ